MNQVVFQPEEVIRALERGHHLLGANHIGETKMQKCARDGAHFHRFSGLKGGWQHMVHVCPTCGRASMWNIDVSKPAEYFKLEEAVSVLDETAFRMRVIRAMEKRDISGARYDGKALLVFCLRHLQRKERFVGERAAPHPYGGTTNFEAIVYACPSCRRAKAILDGWISQHTEVLQF